MGFFLALQCPTLQLLTNTTTINITFTNTATTHMCQQYLLYLRTMYFNGNCFGYSSSYVGQRVCMYVYACKRWKDPPISLESTYISGSNIIDAYTESIHINISLGSGRHYPRVIGFDQSRGTLSTHRSHMGRER